MRRTNPSALAALDRLKRYHHVAAVLAKYGFAEVADNLRSRFPARRKKPPKTPSEPDKARPARIRHALEELGPTFVKFGQLLSTRPDLVAPEYIQELELLQDHVPPVPAKDIITAAQKSLGGKIEDFFTRFDEQPIAAGSIAQIHRAVIPDGSQVAVKICRPHIARTVRTECQILREFSALFRGLLFRHETINIEQMMDSLLDAILKETDLANERRNQIRFARLFADDPTVHVPAVYEDCSSESVLTMEYIDGVKPAARTAIIQQGFDPKEVARRGAQFVLKQMFEYGFFHTDPHPGNLFLLPGNVIAPIDFGQVGRLSSQDRRLFNEIVLSIVERDAANIVRCFERQNMLSEKTNVRKLTADIEQLFDVYHNFKLKDIPFGAVAGQTFDLFRHNFVHPPSQFTLMLKSMATIESLATTLDPDFCLMEALEPYARRFSLADLDPKTVLRRFRKAVRGAGDLVSNLPDDVNSLLTKVRRGNLELRVHHEHLDSLAHSLDRSSNRISFALIIAALLVGSSLLVSQEGTVLGLFTLQTMGIAGYITAGILGIWLAVSILRSGRL